LRLDKVIAMKKSAVILANPVYTCTFEFVFLANFFGVISN